MRMSATGGGTSGAGVPGEAREPSKRADLLTLWAWLMLPMLVVSVTVGSIVGRILGSVVGVQVGHPVRDVGPAGWSVLALSLAIGVLPLAAGVWLGLRGRREGQGPAAIAASALNAVVLVLLVGLSLRAQLAA